MFAQEGTQKQLSKLISSVCVIEGIGEPTRAVQVKSCYSLVLVSSLTGRCVHEGLKTPQQGEPEALLLLTHLPFFRAFLFTAHTFFTQVLKQKQQNKLN